MVVKKLCECCLCKVSIHEFMKGSTEKDGMYEYCKMCRESMPFKPEGWLATGYFLNSIDYLGGNNEE